MDRLEFKFSVDDLDAKTGEFAGYGAVFGNIDSHGDVISPGAFRETLADWSSRGSLPPMKLMHGTMLNPFSGSDLPPGKWREMHEDSKGLFCRGKLSGLNTDRGRFIYSLMEDEALNALSIGYKAVKSSRGSGAVKRQLDVVKLIEVSLLPEGSNPDAVVTSLKTICEGGLPSLPEFEGFLREAGFSKSQAAAIAGKGLAHLLRGEPGRDHEAEVLSALHALL